MESLLTAGHQETPAKVTILDGPESKDLSDFIQEILEENSAQDVIEIDIRGKSSIADYLLVASGRSNRHVSALADYCLLYTSPSPRDLSTSRMPSSA